MKDIENLYNMFNTYVNYRNAVNLRKIIEKNLLKCALIYIVIKKFIYKFKLKLCVFL